MKWKWSYLLIVVFLTLNLGSSLLAQNLERVEPPFWWAGMQNTELQLLVYGENIAATKPEIKHKQVQLVKTHTAKNPNYLFLDIQIANATDALSFPIRFKKGIKVVATYDYELRSRSAGSANRQGFGNEDVLYLITPDRFANGDSSNDEVAGLKEGLDRAQAFGRHGGDIEGIRKNLAHIEDMGFSAIWLNPVLINDQPKYSYHGYATTDYYKVDPRFGSNEDYIQLSKEAKSRGIGMIMDIIVNHCGSEHWWMADPPFDDWINYQDEAYTGTNHRKATLLDPYGSKIDRERMIKGWFVPEMPDLNQRNPFMSKYLIQNSIWWIEYADLKGIRQDTYPYPFREFMTDWTCAIQQEYPNFNIVGEEWVNSPSMISYWQQGKNNADGYDSCLPSLMDFPICQAMREGLVEDAGWTTGTMKLYETLARDYHYPAANDLVIFPDNHDMSRIYTVLNEDYDLFKMAMSYVLTLRGTPQLYYGTEILMSHPGSDSHGDIREDFPGGWAGDTIDGFSGKGLTEQELEAKDLLRKLIHWRKSKTAIHNGELTHYIPENDCYVYFRSDANQTIMVVLNRNDKEQNLDLKRFKENLKNYRAGIDAHTLVLYPLSDFLNIQPKASLILTLK